MSKNENEILKSEKIQTKYDRKKQKRAEEKAKEAQSIMLWKLGGVVVLLAIIGLIAYFPIRNYVRTNKTLFTVGGEQVSQLEYDFYYNLVKNNYLDSYGQYLSYMGMSVNSDFTQMAYSDNMTFADYFQQLTAEQIQQNVGLKKNMEAEGFTCDAEAHYKELIADCEKAAKEANVDLKTYIRASYGTFATARNLKPIIMESYTIGQYLEKVNKDLTPSAEEVETYYQENRDTYDSVDYYLTSMSAQLPTEPTELADENPVFSTEGVYTPSQAEVDEAMAEAKANIEFVLPTIVEDGSFHEGETGDSVNYTIKSWLFDAARKEGDTEIIEGTNMYYAVKFVKRYRSDETTINARVIVTTEDIGDQIVAEYEAGGANLDSFLAVNDKYTTSTAEGGLFEGLEAAQFSGELKDWMFSADRKEGEIKAFRIDDTYTYVVYYVSVGDPIWMSRARTTKLNDIMEEHLDNFKNTQVIDDPDGFLVYLKVATPEAA